MSTFSSTVPVLSPDRQLWDLWQHGQHLDVGLFLARFNRLSPHQVVAILRVDQQQRWRAGERPAAEEYLATHAALLDDAAEVIGLIHGEFLLREERGEGPTVEEYVGRFPHYAERLRRQIENHRALEASASGLPAVALTPSETLARPVSAGGVLEPWEWPPSDALWPEIAGYEILGVLGRGGMGVVYKARQEGLNRIVALKMVLSPVLADPEDLGRFRTEAEAAARVQHPNIVQIHEVGTQDGRPYLCLEYVAGGTLAEHLSGRPLPPRVAAQVTELLARAMHAAHQQGVVHRDLKPANILLRAESSAAGGESNMPLPLSTQQSLPGTPKIADFGLAKQLDVDSGQTRSGTILGTPSYMAPEQASGQPVGPLADVYALGVILYEMLTGRPPFQADSPLATLEMVRGQEPVSPTQLQPTVPRDLETICLKCLRKEPGRRYANAFDLAEDTRRFLAGEPIQARPVGRGERLALWARRKPAAAALIGTVAIFVLLLAGLGAWSYLALSDAADREKDRADEAEKSNERYQKQLLETRRNFYVASTREATNAWEDLDLGLMRERLQELEPPQGQPDLRSFEWHYLHRLSRKGLLSITSHEQAIRCLAFRADGQRLLSVDGAGPARIWDTSNGSEIASMPRKQGAYWTSALYNADGSRIVTLGSNGVCQLWDVAKPEPLRTYLRNNRTNPGPKLGVFSPDGKKLASHDPEQPDGVVVWDAVTGNQLMAFRVGKFVHDLDFGPDSQLLAIATGYAPAKPPVDKAGEVVLWSVAARKHVGSLRGHTDRVNCVAFGGDGTWLVSASEDHKCKVWNVGTQQESHTFARHSQPVMQLLVSRHPLDREIATVSKDGMVKVWDSNGLEQFTLHASIPRSGSVSMAFRPDGGVLAMAGPNGVVSIHDSRTGRELQAFRGFSRSLTTGQPLPVTYLVFSPDGSRLAAGSSDGVIRVWEASAGREAYAGKLPPGALVPMALRPDGRQVAVAVQNGPLRTIALATGQELVRFREQQGALAIRLAYSPDGRRLASSSVEGDVILVRAWEADTGKLLCTLRGHTHTVSLVIFGPDGRQLLTVGGGVDQGRSEAKIWDVETGKSLLELTGHASTLLGAAYSPDGRRIATAGTDKTVRLWDAATGQLERVFHGHTEQVIGVAFSPDGKQLASAAFDRTVKLWEVDTGRESTTLKGHLGAVMSVSFSPDGRRLASGGQDRVLRIWDLDTRKELLVLRGHLQIVRQAAFTADGRRLISNGDGFDARVWEGAADE